jgi:hypothetical protein
MGWYLVKHLDKFTFNIFIISIVPLLKIQNFLIQEPSTCGRTNSVKTSFHM